MQELRDSGRLRAVATDFLARLWWVEFPLFDVFGETLRQVPFEFLRLSPEEFTTRKETSMGM